MLSDLVGVVGGAIGARFAIGHPGKLAYLVLVDTMSLAPFDPAPRFALAMHRFLAGPTERNYDRFMESCTFDLDGVRDRLGERWGPFAAYAVELADSPASRQRSAVSSDCSRQFAPRAREAG